MHTSFTKASVGIFISFLALSSLALIPHQASAATPASGVSETCPLYNPRGVQVALSAAGAGASLGAPLAFSAKISNTNSLPLLDGSLFIKISSADGKIVDRFYVGGGSIALAPGASTDLAFSWNVPAFVLAGQYSAEAYVIDSKQFYVGGVGFVDGFPGGQTAFAVVGENKGFVAFDSTSLTINGQSYSARNTPLVGTTEPVNISVAVRNNLKAATEALVTWKVYKWDDVSEENLLESSVQKINLAPGVATTAKVAVKDAAYSSYRVIGELDWMDAKTITSSRFVRRGVSDSAIDFLGLSAEPGTNGAAIVGCIDSALAVGDDTNFPKTLTIQALDGNREVLNKSYDVARTAIAGFSEALPMSAFGSLHITATLASRDGSTKEIAHISYVSSTGSSSSPFGSIPYIYVIALLAGVFGAILFAKLHKRLPKKDAPITPTY